MILGDACCGYFGIDMLHQRAMERFERVDKSEQTDLVDLIRHDDRYTHQGYHVHLSSKPIVCGIH